MSDCCRVDLSNCEVYLNNIGHVIRNIRDLGAFRSLVAEVENCDVPAGMLGFDCGHDGTGYETVAACDLY